MLPPSLSMRRMLSNDGVYLQFIRVDVGEVFHTLTIGSVLYDVDSGTARHSALVPRNNMQLVSSIGHTW